jgi:hypothetical protein
MKTGTLGHPKVNLGSSLDRKVFEQIMFSIYSRKFFQ